MARNIILGMASSIFPHGPASHKMHFLKHPLWSELAQRIRHSGPIRFDLFMQCALYHPQYGFYSSGKIRTGSQGDFLTPVSAGPVLGQLLARQADEWHAAMGRPASILLVEQGADRGLLAADILTAITSHHPELRPAVRMELIEPSPNLQHQQKNSLAHHQTTFPIGWHTDFGSFSPGEIPCFFYSCELVDSFPVRLARHQAKQWHELLVSFAHDRFVWVDQPASSDLLDELHRWNVPPMEGFTAEIRPTAGTWIRSLARKIRQGLVLTMDYGLPAPDLYHPSRSAGTLVALQEHRRNPDPLQDPGNQDLTSHVNYTELIQEGDQEGLRWLGLTDFSQALTRLAGPILSGKKGLPEKWTRNFQHLTHPGFFGKTHQILVQGKNLPDSFQPSILKPISA